MREQSGEEEVVIFHEANVEARTSLIFFVEPKMYPWK